MPELPEVEVVRAGLAPAVTDARIASVEVYDERSLKRHPGTVESFINTLTGATILGAVRRGKFLWFPLLSSTDEKPTVSLLAHLGMSGQMLLRDLNNMDDKHVRIRLFLEHPSHGDLVINFSDQRIFGSLAINEHVTLPNPAGFSGEPSPLSLTTQCAIPTQAAHIARDPLDPAFNVTEFTSRLLKRNTQIKRAMLDQKLISGIGNIYIDEALWRSGLHYETLCRNLTEQDVLRLLSAVTDVLDKALAEGGTSFDSQYVNVNGESGYFAHSLNVYGKTGKPCSRCGTRIVREKFMNRSSFLCPTCQPSAL